MGGSLIKKKCFVAIRAGFWGPKGDSCHAPYSVRQENMSHSNTEHDTAAHEKTLYQILKGLKAKRGVV